VDIPIALDSWLDFTVLHPNHGNIDLLNALSWAQTLSIIQELTQTILRSTTREADCLF